MLSPLIPTASIKTNRKASRFLFIHGNVWHFWLPMKCSGSRGRGNNVLAEGMNEQGKKGVWPLKRDLRTQRGSSHNPVIVCWQKVCVCVCYLFSCVWLFATPWTVEESSRLLCPWNSPGKNTAVRVTIPFSRGSSLPRDQTRVSCIAGRFFTV